MLGATASFGVLNVLEQLIDGGRIRLNPNGLRWFVIAAAEHLPYASSTINMLQDSAKQTSKLEIANPFPSQSALKSNQVRRLKIDAVRLSEI
jgi:hypothetical protein